MKVKTWMLQHANESSVGNTILVPHEFGGWVDLKDHEALSRRVEVLEKALRVIEFRTISKFSKETIMKHSKNEPERTFAELGLIARSALTALDEGEKK